MAQAATHVVRKSFQSGVVFTQPVVFGLGLLTVIGIVSGDSRVATLTVVILTIALFSRAWARLLLERVCYVCTCAPRQVVEGETFDLSLTIENRKPLPIPLLHVSQFLPAGLDTADAADDVAKDGRVLSGRTINVVTSLAPYQRVTITRKVKASRRGHFEFVPAQFEGGDVFGFYSSHGQIKGSTQGLVVLPSIQYSR